MPDDPLAPRELQVPSECAGQRLDRVLSQLIPGVSRVRLQELIQDGGVAVDGVLAERASLPVAAGSLLSLSRVARSRERAGGGAADFVVLHEDAWLAVIDKPAGMVAHPSEVVRGGTVSERAVARWGPLPGVQGEDRPGIVHRLDADTSGLMVLALERAAAEALVHAFRERAVEKTYLALVHGETRFDSDWISVPLGRRPERPDRISVMEEGGREAETFYETRERFDGFSLVSVRPRTGRTHQIRVHLAHIGHPLVGDRVYRGRATPRPPRGAPALGRHALHASELAFAHPSTGEPLRFQAEPPADMRGWLEWLRRERAR